MSGKRITNSALTRTTYTEARTNSAEILTDWDGLTWARPIPLNLVGNSWWQGSYDNVSANFVDTIEDDHNYVRLSTDGGTEWIVFKVAACNGSDDSHPPVTIGSPDGGLVISGDDTQILTLNASSATDAGSMSATHYTKLTDLKFDYLDNVGTGVEIYKDYSDSDDDRTHNLKTLVSTDGSVVFTENTDTIDFSATGAGGGETNTMLNAGTDGIGVYYQKNGVQFEMRNVASQTDILTVTLDELTEGHQDIDLNIVESNIDHNVLENYDTNEHIDHSAVSILTDEGITGGGDLTTSRTLTLAFDDLNPGLGVQDEDIFALYRDSGSEDIHYYVTGDEFKDYIKDYTDTLYTPIDTAINAGLGLSGGGVLNQSRTLYLDINGLSVVPYSADDYVAVYDTSANTHGKVTLTDLIGELSVSITAGDGMDFTTITSTGDVTLGIPSTITDSTTNTVSGTTHTHEFTLANLISITDVDSTPTSGEYLKWNGTNWVTDDPSVGASSPGLPLNSIQFNDSNAFAGNSGLLYDYSTDTITFSDVNASSGAIFNIGDTVNYLKGETGSTNILTLWSNTNIQDYIKLHSGRVILGDPTLDGNTFLDIADSNSNYTTLLRASNTSGDLFSIASTGEAYLPQLTSDTADNVLYFDESTGLITYGSAPTGSTGGVQTLTADDYSGLSVNGGNTSSASTIDLVAEDNKLYEANPSTEAPESSDYIGYWSEEDSQQKKIQFANLPGWLLNLEGVNEREVHIGQTVNFEAGNNILITFDDATSTLNIAANDAASINTSLSVTGDGTTSTPITLINDEYEPGNVKYYGTDDTGTKGYYDLPTIDCEEVLDCIEDNTDVITDIITDYTGNVYVSFDRSDCEDTFDVTASMFTSETTNLTTIKIVTIPTTGTLTYNGVDVVAGDELTLTLGSLDYTLTYTSDSGVGSSYVDNLTFQLYYSSNSGYLGTLDMNVSIDACVTESICFGYLYNWYTVDDSRELTSSVDWRVSTETDAYDLLTYAGGYAVANNPLKSTSELFWGNTNGTDLYDFRMIGGGYREVTGDFLALADRGYMWTSTSVTSVKARSLFFDSTGDLVNRDGINNIRGQSIRLVKDATGVADGTTTTYTGNDGKTYNAIAINELYWTTENLEETEYRNGDAIPNVTDADTWSNLATGALCLYDNDANYACKNKVSIPLTTIEVNTSYNASPSDCSEESFPALFESIDKDSLLSSYLQDTTLTTDDIESITISSISMDTEVDIQYNGVTISNGDTIDFSNGTINFIRNTYGTDDLTGLFYFNFNFSSQWDYIWYPKTATVKYETTFAACDALYTSVKYGNLYNFYTLTDSRNIAPLGWQPLTYDDWLAVLLGLDPSADPEQTYSNNAGYPAKYAGTDYWTSASSSNTNSSGFNGRETPWRNSDGSFQAIGYNKCVFLSADGNQQQLLL